MWYFTRCVIFLFLIAAGSTSCFSPGDNVLDDVLGGYHDFTTDSAVLFPGSSLSEPICDDEYKQEFMHDGLSTTLTLPRQEHRTSGHGDPDFLTKSDVYNMHPYSSDFLMHSRKLGHYFSSKDNGRKQMRNLQKSDWPIVQKMVWDTIQCSRENKAVERLRSNSKILPTMMFMNDWRRQDDTSSQLTNITEVDERKDTHSGWARDACFSMRRIVGGWSPLSREQFPYMVFVDTGCGGTIISDIWVLTAAHCLTPNRPRYVHAGSLKLLAGCQYNVHKAIVHPKFKRPILRDDIGLLKIIPTFIFSPAIKPIRLASVPAQYRMCGMVTGWGATAGKSSMILNTALIPVVRKDKCKIYGIKRGQFCAGYREGKTDSCQGDSGGPFVVEDFVVGIVSYGHKCAKPHAPGVYVDVFYYRKWISSITGIS